MATEVVAPYSEGWLEHYAKSRHLEFLSVDDLKARYVDLLDNVVTFGSDGKPLLNGLSADTGWTRRIADLRAEVDLRSLGPGWLNETEQVVLNRTYSNVKRAIGAWGDRRFTPERALIKYGHHEHMVDFLERGIIRLTPASEYARSPNPAIRDSELESSIYFPPGTRLQVEMETGSKVFHDIPGIAGLLKYTRRCEDYYVFCASATFDPRWFDIVEEYDACVLIHEWERLIDLIKVQRVPARKISAGLVVYLDPYMPHDKAEVHFIKHLRYGYQKEWRIIWTEPLPPPPLQPYFLELGDLRSFCELITLRQE